LPADTGDHHRLLRASKADPEKNRGRCAVRRRHACLGALRTDLRNLAARGPGIDEITAAGVTLVFLRGERDSVLSSATIRRAHQKVPGSKLTVVPNGPHSLYWEMPEVFNATVHQLLNEVYGLG
jgi:pimeloyl-ACP methyl ester carboxylesterase